MGTISITIATDGKNCKFRIHWEGSDTVVQNVVAELDEQVAHANVATPPKLRAHELLRSLRHMEHEAAARSVRIERV